MKKRCFFNLTAVLVLFFGWHTLLRADGEGWNPQEWKVFPYAKDGSAAVTDGTLQLTADAGGRGIHYFLDRKLPVGENVEISVSFEWRGSTKNPRSVLICAFYIFDGQGKYKNAAIPGATLRLKSSGKLWQEKKVVFRPFRNMRPYPNGFIRFFFNLRPDSSVEIRDFKLNVTDRSAALNQMRFPAPAPLAARPTEFPVGKNWGSRTIGSREFYVTEQGNYARITPEVEAAFTSTGIFPFVVRGYTVIRDFENPAAAWQKRSVQDYLTNRIPITTMLYQRCFGNPLPSQKVLKTIDPLWAGDGQPEEMIYRSEPPFYYFATGKKWKGSSSYLWKEKPYLDYMKNELVPAVEKALPGCTKPGYQWDREKLHTFFEIYCLTYLSVNPRPLCWTMYLKPYTIAARHPGVRTIGTKGGTAGMMAVLRGVARQSGGNKFLYSWRGHEPTELFSYGNSEFNGSPSRDLWGYPLVHLNYYFFRPYLTGINLFACEAFPRALICDPERNKTWELTALGRIVRRMEDYINRNPRRGVPYAAAALFANPVRPLFNRGYGHPPVSMVSMDAADWSNYALVNDLMMPEHRHSRNTGEYSDVASYGEIMDILKPERSWNDPALLDGYKLLIAASGAGFSAENARAVREFVQAGGLFYINAADLSPHFDSAFAGVEVGGKPFSASEIRNVESGRVFSERPFSMLPLTLKGARVLYTAGGKPAVTIFPYGKGQVVVAAPQYLVTSKTVETLEGRTLTRVARPRLLNFADELFDRLFETVTPFSVRVSPENRPDISWSLNRDGDDWLLALYNYSLEKELQIRAIGTGKINAAYPYKSIPFEITAHVPVNDVVELFEGRDVHQRKINGKLVVKESIRSGEIRVYRFSPRRIDLPSYQTRINYALGQPVSVTSTYMSFVPGCVVDGVVDHNFFWQSGVVNKRFPLPQSLTVDLQQERELEGIKLVFHVARSEEPEAKKQIIRYTVTGSVDGKNWKMLRDERENLMPPHPEGTEFFFPAEKFRYVKVEVVGNTLNSGARIVELQCLGRERTTVRPQRKSIVPKHEVRFPAAVEQAQQTVYLTKLKPLAVNPGWMPAGKTWPQMNGWVRLYADLDSHDGLVCTQSLYGESVFSAEYAIPAGMKYFAAACGFGCKDRRSSVEFKVYVDGQLKYDSGVFRIGQRLLPVCVEVAGGKVLKLVTTDAGDGLAADYAWWGDARFVK